MSVKQRRRDDAVKVSQMKTECKFNVPTAERGANPLPRGLAAHIFIETEAAFMCFGVIPRLSRYTLYTAPPGVLYVQRPCLA